MAKICPVCREGTVNVGWRCYNCYMAGLTTRRLGATSKPKTRRKSQKSTDRLV